MGYALRDEGKGFFELAHIDHKQIDGFSRRSKQIEELLEQQGLTRASATTEQKQRATMQSRVAKVATKRDEVLKEWQAKAKELSINFDHLGYIKNSSIESKHNTKSVNVTLTKAAKAEAAKRAVRFAINHLTERESIISESKLLDIAVKQSIGQTKLSDIKNEILAQVKKGYLIGEDTLYRPSDQIGIEQNHKHHQNHRYNYNQEQSQEQSKEQKQDQTQTQSKSKKVWIAELIEKGMSKTDARKYAQEAIKHGRLIKSEALYTTTTAVKREKKILQIEFEGRRVLAPIMPAQIAQKQLKLTNLNHGQQAAALLMTTTTNRVVGIQGFAGTGKSHMLKTSKKMIEQSGYQIQALAPYGAQVKALELLGIKARTLASFLKAKDKNLNQRSVIIIDEAGVVPTRQMEQTLKLIEKTGARIVLLGDKAQTKAIEAGRPFDQLQKEGMSTAYMEQIERQKNILLKEAVHLAAKGDTTRSLTSLQHISSIFEIKNGETRLKRIAVDYTSLPLAERDKTIIVSGTNEARRYINNQIRERLKLTGQLRTEENINKNAKEESKNKSTKEEIVFETLTGRDSTKAERQHAKYYRIGDYISPEKDYHKIGLKQNELYKIEENSSGNKLKVSSKDGSIIEFNPVTHSKLSIYQPNRLELLIGDTVRITKNDPKLNLVNGDRLKVKDVRKDHVILTRLDENEHKSKNDNKNRGIKLMTNKPLHIDYAYATTVHSSQGLTSDRVLIDINTKSLTTTKDIYYVAISRARNEARIYTNNAKALPKAISRERIKSAALDLDIAQESFVRERER